MKRIVIFLVCIISFSIKASAKTELVIATGELPPYTSVDFDKSFLSEIFQAVEVEMGVTFVFKFMPWKRCEMAVQEQEAWGMMPYIRTEERDKLFDCSEKLYSRQAVFFYRSPDGKKKDISFTDLKELSKYRIGGVIGYYYEELFRNAGIEIDLVASEEMDFKKLGAGRVDLVPAEENTGWYMIHNLFPENEAAMFFSTEQPIHKSDIYLMTSKHYPDGKNLLESFNAALKKIKKNGRYQEIMNKRGLLLDYQGDRM